jgi:hypothetical protein
MENKIMAKKYSFDWDGLKEKIITEEKTKKKGFEKDTRFWKHTVDDQGKAAAIIRFIPDTDGNPFVKYYSHSFDYMVDGVKKYWIKNCINTFGYEKECPVCKKNQEYWNSSFEQDKKIASQRKRKLVFVSNILVIKNPANPEDDGKVFLYQYGQKIYEKMKALMFPSAEDLLDEDFKSFVPFDLEVGAEFLLKVKKQGDFPNYDDSKFGNQKKLGTEKEIDKIMEKTYLLEEFMKDDKFPTNEETIKVLGTVLGITQVVEKPKTKVYTPAPVVEEVYEDLSVNDAEKTTSDDIDADMEFFNNLT